MKKKNKIPKPSKEFSEDEVLKIGTELINWFYEKDDHIYVDDFLLINKKMLQSDIDYLFLNFECFREAIENANNIELAKLKKFASADRLNASIVKTILTNKHDWI